MAAHRILMAMSWAHVQNTLDCVHPVAKRRKLEICNENTIYNRALGTVTPCGPPDPQSPLHTIWSQAWQTSESCQVARLGLPQAETFSSHLVDSCNDMDVTVTAGECPCGYLHGPGMLHYHDISAVGLSSNMMRGPD